MIDYIDEKLKSTDQLDVNDVMSKYATDVIGTCAFGPKLGSIKEKDSEFRKCVRLLLKPSFRMIFDSMIRMLLPRFSKRLSLSENSPEALVFFDLAFREVIKYREVNNVNRNDVAQTLMQTIKELLFKNRELYAKRKELLCC